MFGREVDVFWEKRDFAGSYNIVEGSGMFHLSPFLDFFISSNDKMIYQKA